MPNKRTIDSIHRRTLHLIRQLNALQETYDRAKFDHNLSHPLHQAKQALTLFAFDCNPDSRPADPIHTIGGADRPEAPKE